jgi:predicted peptidase
MNKIALGLLSLLCASTTTWAQAPANPKPAPAAWTPPANSKLPPQVKRFNTPDGKDGLDYLAYLPAAYEEDKNKLWPLVIFLHGSGERGKNVQVVRKTGLTETLETRGSTSYVCLAPQCPSEGRGWNTAVLNKFLDQALVDFRVDKNRIILTGLSMGGFGTWNWGCEHPERFAALIPICGSGSPAKATSLKGMPIWAFHGDADPNVKIAGDQAMVDAAKAAGADIKFTIYPGVGHNSWGKAYTEPELDGWILARKK